MTGSGSQFQYFQNEEGHHYVQQYENGRPTHQYWLLGQLPGYPNTDLLEHVQTGQHWVLDHNRHAFYPYQQPAAQRHRGTAPRRGGISPLTKFALLVGVGGSLLLLNQAGMLPAIPGLPDHAQPTSVPDGSATTTPYGGNGNNGGGNTGPGGGGDESGGGNGNNSQPVGEPPLVDVNGLNISGLQIPSDQDRSNPVYITGISYIGDDGVIRIIDFVEPAKEAIANGHTSITIFHATPDRDEYTSLPVTENGVNGSAINTLNQIIAYVQGPPTRVAPTPTPVPPDPVVLDLSNFTITDITVVGGHATEIFYRDRQGDYTLSLAQFAQSAINKGLDHIVFTFENLDGRPETFNLPVDSQGVTESGVRTLNQIIMRQNSALPTDGTLTWLPPKDTGSNLTFVDNRLAGQRDPAELEAARNPLPETMKIAAAAAKRSYAPKV